MGRTEVHRKITSEPWSSMQRLNETNKTTHRSEWRSLLKNCLTGPTLLSVRFADFPLLIAVSRASDHFRLVDHPSRIIGRRRVTQASVHGVTLTAPLGRQSTAA